MAVFVPKDNGARIQAIISRLTGLGMLGDTKSITHLTNGTYEVILNNITLTPKTRTSLNSFAEIKDISMMAGIVRIEFIFTEGEMLATNQ